MPLGLDDLKKDLKKKSRATPATPTPQHAWAGKSSTARPWSDTNLAATAAPRRGGRGSVVTDAVMNEDWLSLEVLPLFWLDVENAPGIAKLQTGLLRLERKFQETIFEPAKAFTKFWRRD